MSAAVSVTLGAAAKPSHIKATEGAKNLPLLCKLCLMRYICPNQYVEGKMNIADEQALQANRETMVSLAWRLAFGKSIDADQRRVFRVWTQVRAKDGRVSANPMVAALTLEFSCSSPTAKKHLKRTVDLGILNCDQCVTDARIKLYSISATAEVALTRIFGWMPLIDTVISSQRAAEPNDFNAGADILPPEIYIDTRSPGAKMLLEKAMNDRMKKIKDAKNGVET
jgi:hypothetical protein